MIEHTKEPWISWRYGSYRTLVGPATNYTVAQCFHTPGVDSAEANARRIVACVNALAHISTEQLESGELLNLGLAIKDLRKQNDELLAELERVKEICLRELGIGIVNEVVLAKARGDK